MQNQWDIGVLKAIDQMILAGNARADLANARSIDPASQEQVPAGVYWVRACVDRNSLKELGRDPAAMTRKEYLRQGSSFNALCAAWVFEVEVAAEKKRRSRHVH